MKNPGIPLIQIAQGMTIIHKTKEFSPKSPTKNLASNNQHV